MANRYRTGNAGDWNGTAGTKWDTVSGGAGGAAEPTSADDVFFDANSASTLLASSASQICKSINFTGYAGVFTGSTSSGVTVYGNVTIPPFAGTISAFAGGIGIRADLGAANVNIAVSNTTFAGDISVTLTTGLTAFLTSNFYGGFLSTGGAGSTGTFDAAGYSLAAKRFQMVQLTELKMGAGTWTGVGTAQHWQSANEITVSATTVTPSTSVIDMTPVAGGTTTIALGNKTYNSLILRAAAGGKGSFTQSATFSTLEIKPASTAQFTAGVNISSGTFTISGTAANLVTIQSDTGAQYTFTKTGGGTVAADYINVSSSIGAPAATFIAGANAVNRGNNTGWGFPNGFAGFFLQER